MNLLVRLLPKPRERGRKQRQRLSPPVYGGSAPDQVRGEGGTKKPDASQRPALLTTLPVPPVYAAFFSPPKRA